MRILTWNINGIRTLPQYHPWHTMKTTENILKALEADILCFQEMKIPKTNLERPTACPPSFDGFFSFPVSNKGYSGVAVYVDRTTTPLPKAAEEGLTGLIQPKPPLAENERVSKLSSYPAEEEMEFYEEEDGTVPSDFERSGLDDEGRTLVLDFGLFVLINVYCPAETSELRLPFKVNFHRLLEARVQKLIEEGREVIVVGDINVCSRPIDHGEGSLASRQKDFWGHPARAWLKSWLAPEGPMIDVVRRFHEGREGMYTCWNVILSARESNYGSRIDYVLATKGLLPWIKFGDIQADVRGSDHCPVYIDLHDSITDPDSGETLALKDLMASPTEPPRICAKFWDQFSSKQMLVSKFFAKRGTATTHQEETASQALTEAMVESASVNIVSTPPPPSQKALGKRKQAEDDPTTATKTSSKASKQKLFGKNQVNGQAKLSNFFGKPDKGEESAPGKRDRSSSAKNRTHSQTSSRSRSIPPEVIDVDVDDEAFPLPEPSVPLPPDDPVDQLEADYLLACSLADETQPEPSPKKRKADPTAWKDLMAPLQPPLCSVHKEPAKRFIVNKPGPNKGKAFFVCSRPVGPGYDKGRGERLREEVNPQYRCDFFKWASDVRRDASRG